MEWTDRIKNPLSPCGKCESTHAHDRVSDGFVVVKMNLYEKVKIRLQCTTVYKREDDDQVYDYR